MEKNRKKKKLKIYETDLSKDIKYRGPLSYRHLKILAWLCMAVGQVALLLSLASHAMPDYLPNADYTITVLEIISSMSLVFWLFSNFAVILDDSDGYKRVLMLNGGTALVIIAIFYFFYYRYVVGIGAAVTGDRLSAIEAIDNHITLAFSSGFLSFNMFIDLFLCSAFMFFLNYKPVRFFKGRKLIIFRLFSILPIVYELVVFILKGNALFTGKGLPVVIFPLLTTKPPLTFLLFIVLAIFIKTREKRFLKHGRTPKEYRQFQQTRRNSFQFSVFAAIMMAVFGILDFICTTVLTYIYIAPDLGDTLQSSEKMVDAIVRAEDLGFGNSLMLLPMAPVMLLFSYTRTYKKRLIDLLIPIGGVLLIILIYLEGGYQFAIRITFLFTP